MPETKDIIPKLEIEKARNALDEAKILFDSEKYYGAANRSYYAAFHAMSALLIHDGYSMKKHSGVISKFRELYIKTGVWDVHGKRRQPVWRCISRMDHGKRYCKKTPTLHEEPLHIFDRIDHTECAVKKYNDLLVRKTIECIKAISKQEIKIIFKGGFEVKAEIE